MLTVGSQPIEGTHHFEDIMKKAIYVELPVKVVTDIKSLANRLGQPMNKLVELALKEFIDNDPQLQLSFKNDSTRKPRKLR